MPPAGTVQVPLPSQTWPTTTLPWQLEAPHEVPDAQSWHAPAPSHEPFWPQVDCAVEAHSLSGSVPARMGPKVPLVPPPFLATEQAWQRPAQALLQQTPSTQKVDAHTAPLAVRLSKELAMWGLDQPTLADALARQVEHPSFHRLMQSEDAREGPKAFAEKRSQQWKGR